MEPRPQDATYTADDLFDISSENGERYELIDGSLLVMEPPGLPHGVVAGNLTSLLGLHVRRQGVGRVVTCDPGFLTRGNDRTVRAPDVAFLSYERFPPGSLPDGYGAAAPDLVVEILSPGDRPREVAQKVREWLSFGVEVVWVVDPRERQVRIETRTGSVLLGPHETLTGGEVLADFAVAVSALFAD